ncbi:MAG: beta-ketoacyl synthase N-terminal-like domain-containing protein, partial [Proteobacteria bacterium]|nr:beta-ketoacyl synthase N-terminal-like domain-containing protein [Pseudomonadota bacterium]
MFNNLAENRTNIRCYEEWKKLNGLRSFLGAPAYEYDSKQIPRNLRRGMSRMSEMAYLATKDALEQAGLNFNSENKTLDFSRTVINLGSTVGSPDANEEYHRKMFENGGPAGQLATTFFKVMNHSVAANVAVALGYKGPLLSTSSACSTSLHAAILGTELVGAGLYDIAVVGGADELHYSGASTFDVVQAASINYNDRPDFASRPFDRDRDGLVISEGASILVIESEEHAAKRKAKVIAEILGGSYFC